jgi:hypothetical protein
VCSSLVTPGVWCLPGGTILNQPKDDSAFDHENYKLPEQRQIPLYLAKLYVHNRGLNSQPNFEVSDIETQFKNIFEGERRLCYKGYCDDPRNTDNAWMETVVYHSHIPEEMGNYLDITQEMAAWCPTPSRPPADVRAEGGQADTGAATRYVFHYRWIFVNNGLPAFTNLFASHYDFVQLCLPICKCGRREFDHSDGSHPKKEESKKPENQGQIGQIQFLGKSTSSHYVRASVTTDYDVLHVRYLLDMWGLPRPNALIAVTGGAQDFGMRQEVEEAVFNGILEAATVTKACIIDGGTDTGVMKLLGEAVQRSSHRLGLIGVAGWGSIIGRESLAQAGGQQCIPYAKTQPNSAWGAGLDPNHRYFILVDDGSVGKFGCEIFARSQLERILRQTHTFERFQKIIRFSNSISDGLNQDHLRKAINSWTVYDLLNLKAYWGLKDKQGHKSEEFDDALHLLDQSLQKRNLSRQEMDDIKKFESELESYSEKKDIPYEYKSNQQETHSPYRADLNVAFCFRCPGNYRDNITLELKLNSVSRSEYDCWYEIKAKFGGDIEHDQFVGCRNCREKLSLKKVCCEEFFPCQGKVSVESNGQGEKQCDFYFFRSRMVELRHKGRNKIICENCRFRAKIDDFLGKFVPGVLIVVQGGPNTIKTVASTNSKNTNLGSKLSTDTLLDTISSSFPKKSKLDSNIDQLAQSTENCTPIVVVDGSGKAADFIASTWRHMHEGPSRSCYEIKCPRSDCIAFKRQHDTKTNMLLQSHCPFVEAEYRRLFGPMRKDGDDMKTISYVIEICRRKESVTVYDSKRDTAGLPYSIMKAICNGTLKDGEPLSTIEKMRLVIDWDLQDDDKRALTSFISQEIMAEENLECARLLGSSQPDRVAQEGGHIRNYQFEKVLLDALTKNSWRMVRLLVQSGVRLQARDSVLKSLYPKDLSSSSSAASVQNCLNKLMNSPAVKDAVLMATYTNYTKGVLMDMSISKSSCADSLYILKHAQQHVLGLKLEELAKTNYFDKVNNCLAKENMDIASFKDRINRNDSFRRELFGTKAHVECVMKELQWAKYESYADILRPHTSVLNHRISFYDGSKTEEIDKEAVNNSEFFIWSILMGRTELAKIFWCNCTQFDPTHCITRALFASAVARRLADSPWADSGAREKLVGRDSVFVQDKRQEGIVDRGSHGCKPLATEFEDLAIHLMKHCYQKDRTAAVRAVSLKWRGPGAWVDISGPARAQSPFRLAEHARAERFVDDPAFQACVSDVWHGGIVAALPSKTGAPRVSSAERIELNCAGDSWELATILVLVSGGTAPPIFLVSVFFGDIGNCAIAVGCSYLLVLVGVILLSRFHQEEQMYEKTRENAIKSKDGAASFLYRLARTLKLIYAAPVVKFYSRSCHLILFVMLYTYVGVQLNPSEYTPAEGTMHAWILLLLLSDFRRFCALGYRRWSTDFWNWLDFAWIACYFAAFLIRCLELHSATFRGNGPDVKLSELGSYNATLGSYLKLKHQIAATFRLQFLDLLQARGLHGAVGVLLWMRLLKVFTVDAAFGPLVLTLLALVRDVVRFLLLLLLFSLGFGAAFVCAARPYPDKAWRCNGGKALGTTYDALFDCTDQCAGQCQSQLWRALSSSFSQAYFAIYGEHFLGNFPARLCK